MSEVKNLSISLDNRFLGKSANIKELYIVNVEKLDFYLATRVDEGPSAVKIAGYLVDSKILQKMKISSYNKILESVKDIELEFLTLPWYKIIYIKQYKYSINK